MNPFISSVRTHLAAARQDDPNYRPGQALFNCLPAEVGRVVSGTMFDPFHRLKHWHEVEQWCADHLIFDDRGELVALFNNNEILLEKVSYFGNRLTPEQRESVEVK